MVERSGQRARSIQLGFHQQRCCRAITYDSVDGLFGLIEGVGSNLLDSIGWQFDHVHGDSITYS